MSAGGGRADGSNAPSHLDLRGADATTRKPGVTECQHANGPHPVVAGGREAGGLHRGPESGTILAGVTGHLVGPLVFKTKERLPPQSLVGSIPIHSRFLLDFQL